MSITTGLRRYLPTALLTLCLSFGLCAAASLPSEAASQPVQRGQTTPDRPAYQRYPAQTKVPNPGTPPPAAPGEAKGKYSNPYDRRVPLQGDTHKGYAPARRDPFKR